MSENRLTLGQLTRATGLARSSLLHYESLGLLVPAGRSAAGYRLYGEAELERLRAIRRFRDAGLSLAAIRDLLDPRKAPSTGEMAQSAELLESRLLDLCRDVERLRGQQRLLARLLASAEFRAGPSCRSKADWVELLRRAGFNEEDMLQWHTDFEADSPAEHATFLRSLGLAPDEVAAIRQQSKPRKA